VDSDLFAVVEVDTREAKPPSRVRLGIVRLPVVVAAQAENELAPQCSAGVPDPELALPAC
jgi:hypothetical protein